MEKADGWRVLVIGASGGVGHFGVQIAKAAGAHVTGVCSGRNEALVRELGADNVIDYTKTDTWNGAGDYDVILDCVGGVTPFALHPVAHRARGVREHAPRRAGVRAAARVRDDLSAQGAGRDAEDERRRPARPRRAR